MLDANHYLTAEQAAADADGGFQTLTLTGRGSQQDLRLLTDGHQPLISEPAEHDQPDRSRQQSDPASKAPPRNQLQLPSLTKVNQGTSMTSVESGLNTIPMRPKASEAAM